MASTRVRIRLSGVEILDDDIAGRAGERVIPWDRVYIKPGNFRLTSETGGPLLRNDEVFGPTPGCLRADEFKTIVAVQRRAYDRLMRSNEPAALVPAGGAPERRSRRAGVIIALLCFVAVILFFAWMSAVPSAGFSPRPLDLLLLAVPLLFAGVLPAVVLVPLTRSLDPSTAWRLRPDGVERLPAEGAAEFIPWSRVRCLRRSESWLTARLDDGRVIRIPWRWGAAPLLVGRLAERREIAVGRAGLGRWLSIWCIAFGAPAAVSLTLIPVLPRFSSLFQGLGLSLLVVGVGVPALVSLAAWLAHRTGRAEAPASSTPDA